MEDRRHIGINPPESKMNRRQPFQLRLLTKRLVAFGWYFIAIASLPCVPAQEAGQQPTFPAQDIEFFEAKIRPLLSAHCLECHGNEATKIRGGLWLTSRQQLLEGGDSGPAVVLGKPEESLLISAVHFEDYEMPPRGKLKASDIELLEQWVRLGLPDPRTPNRQAASKPINIEAGRAFWSFRPLAAKPKVVNHQQDRDWCRTEIDRFILQRLQKHQLTPVADANRYQLLRRVHLAITGLPPTPDQIQAFATSQRSLDDDLAELVDRLLQSDGFGERWGRHWLDVARFAESSGGGRSLMFPEAWRFRDYVIQSYNADKPFNQMIREQIAGDLLPFDSQSERNANLTAVGFLALGPTNYEQQDKELLRMEVIDEQVDTVGRAFLGMTLGCARCHDHKFDPIPTEDYYALAGIFGSTVSLVDGNVSTYVTQPLANAEQQAIVATYQKKLAQLTRRRKQLQKQLIELGGKQRVSHQPRRVLQSGKLRGVVVDNQNARLIGKWQESVYVKAFVDAGYLHDDGQPKGRNQAIFAPQLETGGQYEVRLAYSASGNRASNTLVVIDHQDGRKTLRVNQSKRPPIQGLFLSLGSYRFEADNVAKVTISNEGADGVVIADAVQFISKTENKTSLTASKPDGTVQASPAKRTMTSAPEWVAAKREFEATEKQLKILKSNAPQPFARAMSVKDSDQPADGHVHIRGNVRQLGDVVARGFLQVVTDKTTWPEIPDGTSGRLPLANWIASPQNPLTARVYVNRVWRHLFGRGIVETTDNFGAMGMRPSHPQLLDYLADRFVREGWSTKKLIRHIMLSRVFRLSTQTSEKAMQEDAENRLLWRANRRRMDAEVLRDSILFASGQLDPQAGGLTIRKITQYDLGYTFQTRRRSVYVPAFRNSMLELFEVFDIANPNMVTGHRNTSTLPTQALFLMNSPWVMEQSRAMAKSVCEQRAQDSERLKQVFLRLLGRPPSATEAKLANQYLESMNDIQNSKVRWQRLIHATIGSLDFRYIN